MADLQIGRVLVGEAEGVLEDEHDVERQHSKQVNDVQKFPACGRACCRLAFMRVCMRSCVRAYMHTYEHCAWKKKTAATGWRAPICVCFKKKHVHTACYRVH